MSLAWGRLLSNQRSPMVDVVRTRAQLVTRRDGAAFRRGWVSGRCWGRGRLVWCVWWPSSRPFLLLVAQRCSVRSALSPLSASAGPVSPPPRSRKCRVDALPLLFFFFASSSSVVVVVVRLLPPLPSLCSLLATQTTTANPIHHYIEIAVASRGDP
jgi:hypothetical protein